MALRVQAKTIKEVVKMAKRKQSPGEERETREGYTVKLPTMPPLPQDFQGGKYANHILVGSTQWEFFLDFWRVDVIGATEAKPAFVERIILSPHNVKGLVDALSQTIGNFERDSGISLPNMRGAKLRSESEG